MKKLTALLLILCTILSCFSGCARNEEEAYVPTGDAILLEGQDPEDLIVEEEKSIYRYAKLVWNEVDIGDDNWQIYMDRQDGQYSIAPLRYVEQEYRPYKLSGGEKEQLRSKK